MVISNDGNYFENYLCHLLEFGLQPTSGLALYGQKEVQLGGKALLGSGYGVTFFKTGFPVTLIISFLYHHFRVGGHSYDSRTAPSPAR